MWHLGLQSSEARPVPTPLGAGPFPCYVTIARLLLDRLKAAATRTGAAAMDSKVGYGHIDSQCDFFS